MAAGSARDLDDWFRAESELLHPLPLELKETDGDFTVRAEVPGFTAEGSRDQSGAALSEDRG